MSNPVALITGSTSGIGEAFAIQLAMSGSDIILHGRREEKLNRLSKKLAEEYNVQTKVLVADLVTTEGREMVAKELQQVDNLAYLINNAGFTNIGDFLDINWEDHANLIEVHMIATTQFCHIALTKMVKQNKGVIINVSSIGAFVADSGMYATTKMYIIRLSDYLHTLVRGTGVKIQVLCPGFTYSDFHKRDYYIDAGLDIYSTIPKFMWMTAEKVVTYSLKKSKTNKLVVIPGILNKVIVRLSIWGLIRRRFAQGFLNKKNYKSKIR